MHSIFTAIGYLFVIRQLDPYIRTILHFIWNYITTLIESEPPKWTEKYGLWAVVTGSTDGIGKAYARELAERGMNIVLISRTQEKLDRVAAEIRDTFKVRTKTVQADFKNSSIIFEHIEQELKDLEIGILVNNVGMCFDYPIPFHEVSACDAQEHVQVNIISTLLMTQMILPKMRQRNKGAIVNVSSIAEMAPWPFFSTYSASKAFIQNFTLALQNENRDKNIDIQLLSPSMVKTKLVNYSPTCNKLGEFLAPEPEIFARHAVKTLGCSSHTAGFNPHNLQHFLHQISNIYVRTFIMGILSRIFHYQHIRQNSKEK